MAQKITAKDLSYDSSLPPFLAALRAQAAGHSQSPPPQRRGVAKKRSASEELEDAPLVVDEHGNTIDLDAHGYSDSEPQAVSRSGSVKQQQQQQQQKDGDQKTATATATATETRSAMSVGASKKRKVGKVVGGETDGSADGEERQGQGHRQKRTQTHKGHEMKITLDAESRRHDAKKKKNKTDNDRLTQSAPSADTKASRKKLKKIKLSFDEAEG